MVLVLVVGGSVVVVSLPHAPAGTQKHNTTIQATARRRGVGSQSTGSAVETVGVERSGGDVSAAIRA